MLKKYHGILLLLPLLVIFNINELAAQTNDDNFILDLPETSNKINFNFYGNLQLYSNVDLQNFVISEGLPGNGTESNPYVISGYYFVGYWSSPAVDVSGIDLHFTIRDCQIDGGNPAGIEIINTQNAQIINNTIGYSNDGIVIQDSSNIVIKNNSISDNTYYGLNVVSSENMTINENYLTGNLDGLALISVNNTLVDNNGISSSSGTAIDFSNSRNITLSSNTIDSCNTGLYGINSYNVSLVTNKIISNSLGVSFSHLIGGTFSDNDILNCEYAGAELSGNFTNFIVSNNLIGFNKRTGIVGWFLISPIIVNNNITGNLEDGVAFYDSSNIELSNNMISKNSKNGIFTRCISETTIESNEISENGGYGLFLENSPQNQIKDNIFNGDSLFLYGSNLDDYYQEEVSGNVVNNHPLIFWQDRTGESIPSDVGQVILINCQSISVIDQDLNYIDVGIAAFFSTNITIQDCTSKNNDVAGIMFNQTTNSKIVNSLISDNTNYGFWLISSPNNTILSNKFISNGIYLSGSTLQELYQNSVSGNTVNDRSLLLYQNQTNVRVSKSGGQVILLNCEGMIIADLTLTHSDVGIAAFFSRGTEIYGNTISHNNNDGILLSHSSNNAIYDNLIWSNFDDGIRLVEQSDSNLIERNNFYGNNAKFFVEYYPMFSYYFSQARDFSEMNIFRNNYWNYWVSPDFNNDGIVDNPYYISGGNSDHFPAVHPHILPQLVKNFLFPQGENISGVITITWEEPMEIYGEKLYFDIYYSSDTVENWIVLELGYEMTFYQWDTSDLGDGTYQLMLKVYSPSTFYFIVTSDVFMIINSDQTGRTSASFSGLSWVLLALMTTLILSKKKREE